ncbi:hypothetical protein CEXT_9411, partial [Caerostris extrusa]
RPEFEATKMALRTCVFSRQPRGARRGGGGGGWGRSEVKWRRFRPMQDVWGRESGRRMLRTSRAVKRNMGSLEKAE